MPSPTERPFSSYTQDRLLKLEKRVLTNMPNLDDVYPTVNFSPNRVQKTILKMLVDGVGSGIRSFGVLPGNGVGKTTLLVHLIWSIADGPQNKYWDDVPFIKDWPFRKHLRLVCDAADMKEGTGATWLAIDQFWPKGFYTSSKQGYDYDSAYSLPNGFILSVRTYDQPRKLHESANLGAVFFNEPGEDDSVWKQYGARLRGHGFRALFGTVWNESGYWIEEEIVENPEARYCFGDIHDCCKDHYDDGHMSHREVEATIADYPEDQREARQTGRFKGMTPHVFSITPEVHFFDIDELLKDMPDFFTESTAYAALDPHPLKPWCYIVGRIHSNGNWYIVDEWPKRPYHKIGQDHSGIGEFVATINEMDEANCVRERVIDRKGSAQNIRKEYGSTTVRNQLEDDFGLHFIDGNTNVEGEIGGVSILKTLLRYRTEDPVDTFNHPKIYIARSCWNSCYQLQNCLKKRSIQNPSFYSEDIDQKFFDFPRTLMYLVMAGFRYRPGESKETLHERVMGKNEKDILKLLKKRNASITSGQTWNRNDGGIPATGTIRFGE